MPKLPTPSEILGSSYKLLPQESQLLLITSVLGTSPAWLTYTLLHDTFTTDGNIVLISFVNEYTYFRDGAKRHGIDLPAQLKSGKFTFIDGFSRLFIPPSSSNAQIPPSPLSGASSGPAPRGIVPVRGAAIPARQPRAAGQTSGIDADTGPSATEPIRYLSLAPYGPSTIGKQLDLVRTTVKSQSTPSAKPRLVIEGLDFLLAANIVDVDSVESFIHDLREITSTTAIILPSDSALLNTTPSSTPLELSHANLVVSLGHVADAILSLRLLDTGVAKDISGVLKVTRGAGNLWKEGGAGVVEEKEMLYYESDGGVKIFARGAGGH